METISFNSCIWAVSDGRAGNVAMASGLAARVAEITGGDVERRDVSPRAPWVWAPPGLWLCAPASLILKSAGKALAGPPPGLIIAAGRRAAPYALAMKARHRGVKAVQILDSGLDPARFDLVVAPEHDGLKGANVVATLGSVHRVTHGLLMEEGVFWLDDFAALPRPRIAVLIGGATRRTSLKSKTVEALASDLKALSQGGAGLMITASRRTGEANAARLRAALPEAWFWDGAGENPYFGMLAQADAIIVTDDSVNMASEAVATGKPLAIWPLLKEGGKIARFHDALIARGCAENFSGRIPRVACPGLDEAGRAAAAVARLLRTGR